MFKKGDSVRSKITGQVGTIVDTWHKVRAEDGTFPTINNENLDAYIPPTPEETWAIIGSLIHQDINKRDIPLANYEVHSVLRDTRQLLTGRGIEVTEAVEKSIVRIIKAVEKQVKEEGE